ncbi:MAG: N-acetylneuraminate synthase [Dehalococcoidales bacterium]|nr:N-acetylneuraminate synthase [Dehalococcoidales bacterium]
MRKIDIGGRLIGENEPCFIIAEAGVNHNGDVDLAKQLIDVAVEAGADAVKFQTFHAEQLVTAEADKAQYQKAMTGENQSQFDMLKNLEFSEQDFIALKNYSGELGICFLSSPFDIRSVDFLEELGVAAYKIPSGEITNIPYLRHIARKRKPVVVSTGMATIDEIEQAVEIFSENEKGETVILHCVTSYPAKPEDTNLKFMVSLSQTFGLPVGLSDHTTSVFIPTAAVAMGACVIEKHFTLNKRLPGPDHQASLEPQELTAMISGIRDTEKAIGDGIKRLTPEEEANKKAARRSLVAGQDISIGQLITEEMVNYKRSTTDERMEIGKVNLIVGKKAKKPIACGETFTLDKVE